MRKSNRIISASFRSKTQTNIFQKTSPIVSQSSFPPSATIRPPNKWNEQPTRWGPLPVVNGLLTPISRVITPSYPRIGGCKPHFTTGFCGLSCSHTSNWLLESQPPSSKGIDTTQALHPSILPWPSAVAGVHLGTWWVWCWSQIRRMGHFAYMYHASYGYWLYWPY